MLQLWRRLAVGRLGVEYLPIGVNAVIVHLDRRFFFGGFDGRGGGLGVLRGGYLPVGDDAVVHLNSHLLFGGLTVVAVCQYRDVAGRRRARCAQGSGDEK